MMAKSKEEFEKAAAGLPTCEPGLSAEVVCIERVDAAYFRDGKRRQRCIGRTKRGLCVSTYD